jgi:hypothetical protein
VPPDFFVREAHRSRLIGVAPGQGLLPTAECAQTKDGLPEPTGLDTPGWATAGRSELRCADLPARDALSDLDHEGP